MNRPSEKALRLGEELFDYVPHGLTRFNAVHELAEMVDEANRDLLDAVRAVLQDAQRNGGVPAASYIANLRRVFFEYEPITWPSDSQGERAGIGPAALWSRKEFFTSL
jgi:hypothetical protein